MYYIYHIPNVKIGCTHNLQNRLRQQTKGEWEILETHTDIDIASQRELQLQKEYGYEVDKSTYKESVQNFKLESVVKAGRASATKSWQNHRERELEKCKKGGAVSREKFSKKTIMCDMDGNPVKEFKNRKDAAKYVNGHGAPLTGVLNNPNRSYKGYKWRDENNSK